MKRALILYGGPGTGKDTIAARLDKRAFRLFPRTKHGPGRTAGYRIVDDEGIRQLLAKPAETLWVTSRYGATYVVDRSRLDQHLADELVPVLLLGEPEAVDRITSSRADIGWTVVELTCPRAVAASRIVGRATGDEAERLAVYDSTPRLHQAALRIDTSRVDPDSAALMISRSVLPSGPFWGM